MTNDSLKQAVHLMADAYKAGYTGKPIEQVDTFHPTLEQQYMLGKHHAEAVKPSDFARRYGAVA